MGILFEEIDSQSTPLGELSLRRRRIPTLGEQDIYEVKLGGEFLMSSLFTEAEVALADLGLHAVDGSDLAVVVGGLGLGYTARAALQSERVGEVLVIEALAPVIGWHREGKVPLGNTLNWDSRCRFIHADFFARALRTGGGGFDPSRPERQFDAILLDVDHAPDSHLDNASAGFYTTTSLRCMATQLRPGGAFAMWSNDLPDQSFIDDLAQVFENVNSHIVSFYNPFQNAEARNTVYVCGATLGSQ